jgi:hypothetical protein
MVDSFTTAQAFSASTAATRTQKQKFARLYSTQHQAEHKDTEKVVVNITDRNLDPAAIAILSKGLNFAQTSNIRSNL